MTEKTKTKNLNPLSLKSDAIKQKVNIRAEWCLIDSFVGESSHSKWPELPISTQKLSAEHKEVCHLFNLFFQIKKKTNKRVIMGFFFSSLLSYFVDPASDKIENVLFVFKNEINILLIFNIFLHWRTVLDPRIQSRQTNNSKTFISNVKQGRLSFLRALLRKSRERECRVKRAQDHKHHDQKFIILTTRIYYFLL